MLLLLGQERKTGAPGRGEGFYLLVHASVLCLELYTQVPCSSIHKSVSRQCAPEMRFRHSAQGYATKKQQPRTFRSRLSSQLFHSDTQSKSHSHANHNRNIHTCDHIPNTAHGFERGCENAEKTKTATGIIELQRWGTAFAVWAWTHNSGCCSILTHYTENSKQSAGV